MLCAVTDANVVISGTISPLGASARVLKAWRINRFQLVTCPKIIEEVAEKRRLPRIQKKYQLKEAEIAGLLLNLGASYMVAGKAEVSQIPPDLDDTMLFSAAL